MNVALWIIQVLLAALFVFAGGAKLVMSIEQMQQGGIPLPGPFLRFIGVAEVAGGLGLVLPGLFRIRPGLTPLAALGLIVIMIGAVVVSAMSGPIVMALLPFLVGILLVLVVYGRWGWAPAAR